MDDLVSRAAALDAIDGIKTMRGNMEQLAMKALCWAAVKIIQPVDAAPVAHGRWKDHHAKVRGYGKVYYQHDCIPILYESPYKYCPNCGAKMDEELRSE